MSLLIYFIYAFVALILITAFVNIKLSVSLYVSYLILVPYLNIPIGSINLGYNLVNTIILLSFLYYQKVKKKHLINFNFTLPFLFLFFFLLFLGLFGDLDFSIQLGMWRANFMNTVLLPFVIWNLGITDKDFHRYMIKALMISFGIAGVYALYLTSLGGMNPYTTFLSLYFGKDDFNEMYMKGGNETRILTGLSTAARIASTASHPMNWMFYIGCFLCFLFIYYLKTDKKYKFSVLSLLFVYLYIVVISGVRTGIAALLITVVYFLIMNRKFKYFMWGGIVILVLLVVVNSNDMLHQFFLSFIDIKGTSSDVAGSSVSMRLNQLQGVIDEIKHNPFTGHGYGWTDFYSVQYGSHPVMLGFESLIYSILCNSGFIGMGGWILFFILLVRLNGNFLKVRENRILMNTLIVFYVGYCIGTGDYSYQQYFAIFYSFLLSYLYQSEKYYNGRKKSKSNSILSAAIPPDSRK